MYETLRGHGFQVESRTGLIVFILWLGLERKVFDRVSADTGSQHRGVERKLSAR